MKHYLSTGDRIKLLEKPDQYSARTYGDMGTIENIEVDPGIITKSGEDEEKIWINWDDGGKSALILSKDKFRVIPSQD
jgi:hypothetical protein